MSKKGRSSFFDRQPTTPDKKRDARISSELKHSQRAASGKIQVLLLGAGETGKTTIFKQMQFLKGGGFPDEYFEDMKDKICANLIEGTVEILKAIKELDKYKIEGDEAFTNASDTILNKAHAYVPDAAYQKPYEERILDAKEFLNREFMQYIDDETFAALKVLWNHEGYRKALFELRRFGRYNVPDSYDDLVQKLLEGYPAWGGKGWMPDTTDVLLARVRTTGFHDVVYGYKGHSIRLVDVGGQRSERRKWVNLFDGIHGVIFVAALSEYDQTMFEDNAMNRMKESIDLFADYVNRPAFSKSAIILFLNKKDLFEKKFLKNRIPLNTGKIFENPPEYDYEDVEADFEAAIEFIEGCFLESVSPERLSHVYTYVTSALDSSKMEVLMVGVQDNMLRANLQQAGLSPDFED